MGNARGRNISYARVGSIDMRVFDPREEDVLLDAGTGGGRVITALASRCRTVCATDINRDSLRRLRENVKDNMSLVQADLTRMPFAECAFTKVVCTEVLEHLPNPADAMAELHRIVRPGGIVVAAVPTRFSERLYSRLNRRYSQNQGQHISIFSRSVWLRLFRGAHLEPVAVKNENFLPALHWTFRSIFPTPYDASSGRFLEKRSADTAFWLLMNGLNALTFGAFNRLGSSIFPKSWYFYLAREGSA